MRQAMTTGRPVVVSSMTDERTLVTANPETGMFEAELSGNVARVRTGTGAWRDPSTRLIREADGSWRAEAAVAQVSISPGGSAETPLASISDGSAEVRLTWPERLPPATIDGGTATYAEVLPGVDLVVRAGLESVETLLIVKNRESSRHPNVRSWSMPIATSEGLSSKTHPNGAVSLIDRAGVERMRIPPALMWDSSGKQPGNKSPHAPLADVAETRTVPVVTRLAEGRITTQAHGEFLDDPETVYPVVIDPAVSLGQTRVLRVTDDWSQWGGQVGSHGKVGYNGWSSPYYRSRMFYQFTWGKNSDGTFVRPTQIAKAEFQYKQDHSPQFSPCDSTSSAYPGVYAKLNAAQLGG